MTITSNRIPIGVKPKDGIRFIRESKGYFVSNSPRDVSQSDFKSRILPHTDLLVAGDRDAAGYFSLEISGGASVHVDMMRKQISPFDRLQLLRKKMPNTMLQAICRGAHLFGYRPYPENVIRATVQSFAKYVDVWRVFDFLNHVPNMIPVYEEVKKTGKYLEAAICFSTGPEHTDEYYVKKVGEILDVAGNDVILVIKNHSGIGTPSRIYKLVASILKKYPDLVVHYHGHNTDGNDVARIVAAVKAGAKIVDAGDHALTGYFGPPPALTVVQTLAEEGYEAIGINLKAIIECNEKLKKVRPLYTVFEPQIKGFDPTVHIHKLPGGAMGYNYEQAAKGRYLAKMSEILLDELPKVHRELGNFCSAAPGSQILWSTAVSNVLTGRRYENPTQDLKRFLLEQYGPFPFQRPADDIYRAAFGVDWKRIVAEESGMIDIPAVDIEYERGCFESALCRKVSDEELVLYLLHPRDAVEFFKFEGLYGKTYVLPPEIWFRLGGFAPGEEIAFEDYTGKHHRIVFGPSQKTADGTIFTLLTVNHHPETFTCKPNKT